MILLFLIATLAAATTSASSPFQNDDVTAIVGATIIDGNGGPPLTEATIVVSDGRITDIGPKSSIEVAPGAQVIDGTGKYVMPGLVDTNVHMSPLRGQPTFARYWDRLDEIVLQGVQLQLKYGTTTVRDSYGTLLPLIKVRDAIARGDAIGPRVYVAGNIIGWGGPYSDTFSRIRESGLSLFEEQINDFFSQGTGEDLMHMTPDELRLALNAYLDKGPDFIKFGGTWHINYPTLISFSPRAQRVIVEETQKRGLVAETHSTTLEGLLISIEAGIDLIQHPEVVGHREITDELVELIVEREIICSLLPNKYTGKIWEEHLEKQDEAKNKQEEEREAQRRAAKTTAELRREQEETGIANPETLLIPNLEMRRRNAKKLIEAGAIISVGPDNVIGVAPEFRRTKKSEHLEPGIGTIIAIEGLVELGMTPSQAIVAATRNGALACKGLEEFGTLEVGKLADLLMLGSDPLADISNLRTLEMVMKEGQNIDLEALPTVRPYRAW
jgi:imidazolonepropionase-like amidohydrolase